MPDFTVDIDGLDALGKNLERAKENLDGALKAMEDIGPDSIGPDDLDDACAEFRDDWERGLDKVGECVQKITDALKQARKNYAEIENALTDGFTKMRETVETRPQGPTR